MLTSVKVKIYERSDSSMRKKYRAMNIQAFETWKSRMSRANSAVLFDGLAAKVLTARGFNINEIKYQPRSLFDPDQLYSTLELFMIPSVKVGDAHMDVGKRRAFRMFAKPKHVKKLEPLSRPEERMDLTKSAGLPTLTSKREVWNTPEARVKFLTRVEKIMKGLATPQPCLCQARTQKNNKTRLVWAFPFEMTYIEAMFAYPLIDHFAREETPIATGASKLSLGLRVEKMKSENNTVLAVDYSKYDSSVSAEDINFFFTILKTWYDEKWYPIIDIIARYFTFTPIVMPDGYIHYGKVKGVPSGSMFTQICDSMVNVKYCFAVDSKFRLGLKPKNLLVLGDDVLEFFNYEGDRDKLMGAISEYLAQHGVRVNVDKTQVGVPHFLGAVWDKGTRQRDLEDLLSNMVYPERYRKYSPGIQGVVQADLLVASSIADCMQGGMLVAQKKYGHSNHLYDSVFSYTALDESHVSGYLKVILRDKKRAEHSSSYHGARSSASGAYFS